MKSRIKSLIVNAFGFKTTKKIIVIESDDWGSIRMPSRGVYRSLLKRGINVDLCPYNRVDNLESENDLNYLFDVLSLVRDKNGQSAKITANFVMSNPDFGKIEHSGFMDYHSMSLLDSYKQFQHSENSFAIVQKGMQERVFIPQFHGREHLNVPYWMQWLQNSKSETRLAFNHGVFGISTNITTENRKSFLSALGGTRNVDIDFQKSFIKEGMSWFKETFGYQSTTFIAPNYTWGNWLLETLCEEGIVGLQGGRVQYQPNDSTGVSKIRHYMGQSNKFDQRYLIRNVKFEPTSNPKIDWIDSALKEVNSAFTMNSPAIISTHRLNFMGEIEPANRGKNLDMFLLLLKRIVSRYPDVEFLSSNELVELMKR